MTHRYLANDLSRHYALITAPKRYVWHHQAPLSPCLSPFVAAMDRPQPRTWTTTFPDQRKLLRYAAPVPDALGGSTMAHAEWEEGKRSVQGDTEVVSLSEVSTLLDV